MDTQTEIECLKREIELLRDLIAAKDAALNAQKGTTIIWQWPLCGWHCAPAIPGFRQYEITCNNPAAANAPYPVQGTAGNPYPINRHWVVQ